MRPKSEIYTPKRDDEHPRPFHMGVPSPPGGDYIKPNLELSPDQVILHVGTNDLKQKEPQQVADSIVDLARQIENSSEASITMSELFPRTDKFNEAVTTTNVHFKSYCRQNGWELIQFLSPRCVSPFLAWGDFHARSRFAGSTIPEEKWGTTCSLRE